MLTPFKQPSRKFGTWNMRAAKLLAAGLLLALPLLFSGCLLMMASSQPTELTLRNKCPFPIVVVINYESGIQKKVSVDAGDSESKDAFSGEDPAESLTVEADGKVLYSYTLPPQHGPLKCNLTPTEMTIVQK